MSVRTFDIFADVPATGGVMAFVGKRNTGKTSNLKQLLLQRAWRGTMQKQAKLKAIGRVLSAVVIPDEAAYVAALTEPVATFYATGLIFNATEEHTLTYQGLLPPEQIHSAYDPDAVLQLLRAQRQHVQMLLCRYAEQHNGRIPSTEREWLAIRTERRAFVVLDDVFHDAPRLNKDHVLRALFKQARFYGIDVFVTMHWLLDYGPRLRQYIDVVLFHRTTMHRLRTRLYEHYCSFIDTYSEFEALLNRFTDAFGALALLEFVPGLASTENNLRAFRAASDLPPIATFQHDAALCDLAAMQRLTARWRDAAALS